VRFYAVVGRGRRETIAHEQGSGRRAVKRNGETLRPVDACDVLDRNKPAITLKWMRNECRRLQGQVIGGEDYTAKRQAEKSIPTFRHFVDEIYGPWLRENPDHRDPDGTLARLRTGFVKDFGDDKLDTITPRRLDTWKARRMKHGAKAETVNRDLTALKSAFARYAEWNKKTFDNPLRGYKLVKVDRARRVVRAFTNDELAALIKAAETRDEKKRTQRDSSNRWREARGYATLANLDGIYPDCVTPAIIVAVDTGMRRGEQLALTWDRVDLKAGTVHVEGVTTKTYESRTIPLTGRAQSVLRHWHLQQGRPRHGLVFGGVQNLKRSFNRLLDQAGIERANGKGRVSWHSLRHSFGSRLGAAGTDGETLRSLMGHADLRTTQRYLHAEEERKRAAVEALS
jgi:integrase